jgi:hypothetical protein
LTVSPDRRVFWVLPAVEIYDSEGAWSGGFAVGDAGHPARVTAVKAFGNEFLVADATARHIRRYDRAGKQIGAVGTRNKTGGFMLPNRSLDMDIDAKGVIHATDSGRHRVTSWALEGEPWGILESSG